MITIDAKEYLEQIRKIDTMIENKLAEQQRCLDIALNVTTSLGEKVQSTPNGQRASSAMDKYIDLGREIDVCINELYATKQEIIKTIEQLCEPEYDVLHKMYVQYLTFDEIADKRQKSKSWATTTHGHALISLEKLLKMREKT